MKQQKHRKPARNFTIRKGGYITKSQLGKRGTILSESRLLDFEVEKRKLGRTMGEYYCDYNRGFKHGSALSLQGY